MIVQRGSSEITRRCGAACVGSPRKRCAAGIGLNVPYERPHCQNQCGDGYNCNYLNCNCFAHTLNIGAATPRTRRLRCQDWLKTASAMDLFHIVMVGWFPLVFGNWPRAQRWNQISPSDENIESGGPRRREWSQTAPICSCALIAIPLSERFDGLSVRSVRLLLIAGIAI